MSTARNFLTEASESVQIHSPFFPADVREGDPIRATLEINGKTTPVKPYKISPLGLEIVYNSELCDVKRGDTVNLTITMSSEVSQYNGVIITSVYEKYGQSLMGIRLTDVAHRESNSIKEKRSGMRWLVASQFMPTGVAPNPVKFNDFVYFKVKDISKAGMQLVTSLRNKHILKDMKLECTISFPMVGQARAIVKVNNVRLITDAGKDCLSVGVELVDKNESIEDLTGQYLLQFSNVESLEQLRKENFKTSNVGSAVTFKFVKTKEDYEKVLELRRTAYIREGKVPPTAGIYDVATEHDSFARIVVGYYRDQVVCSGAIIYHDLDSRSEQEDYIKWDERLPKKENSVEINRLCTHPDFRGSDLLLHMFRFMYVTISQSKRDWLVIYTCANLKRIYDSIGLKYIGIEYDHKVLGNQKHYVMAGYVPDGVCGRGVGPIMWNLVYADAVKFLLKDPHFFVSEKDKYRMSFYLLFYKFAHFLFKRKLKSKGKKVENVKAIEKAA